MGSESESNTQALKDEVPQFAHSRFEEWIDEVHAAWARYQQEFPAVSIQPRYLSYALLSVKFVLETPITHVRRPRRCDSRLGVVVCSTDFRRSDGLEDCRSF